MCYCIINKKEQKVTEKPEIFKNNVPINEIYNSHTHTLTTFSIGSDVLGHSNTNTMCKMYF